MYYRALFAFHLVYYAIFSGTTFLPKYFGELGMTDAQIGLLMSLPAIAGVVLQPLFGILTDRARKKKYIVIGLCGLLAVVCFVLDSLTGFAAIFIGMSVFYIVHLPIAPAYGAITLEYTSEIGKPYGPIRLCGTIGFQLGALVVGAILADSLSGLYRLLGIVMVLSCAVATMLPPIAGHQHGRQKVRLSALLTDKHLLALLGMVLIGTVTTQFYNSFFSKHLGDLGIDNTMTGIMLFVSVIMEIPFLIFGDRLFRRASIWNWMILGFVLNALRWLGFALFKSVPMLLLFQIPGVSVLAFFEFFPALYIARRVSPALQGSAQMALMLVSFGLSRVIGSLLGGVVAGWVGIPAVFAFNGIALLVAAVLYIKPTRRWLRTETAEEAQKAVT